MSFYFFYIALPDTEISTKLNCGRIGMDVAESNYATVDCKSLH